ALIRQNRSSLIIYGSAGFPVAGPFLEDFFLSDSIVGKPTAVNNFSHCEAADEEIRAAKVEQDIEKRIELWKIAQTKIIEDVCAIPIYQQGIVWAHRDTIDFGHEAKASLTYGPIIDETTSLRGE